MHQLPSSHCQNFTTLFANLATFVEGRLKSVRSHISRYQNAISNKITSVCLYGTRDKRTHFKLRIVSSHLFATLKARKRTTLISAFSVHTCNSLRVATVLMKHSQDLVRKPRSRLPEWNNLCVRMVCFWYMT